jgi:hypothetical protein
LISIQLPGNRRINTDIVGGDNTIINLKISIAKKMGVKSENWGIYIPIENRLRRVPDETRLDQIDLTKLHFYPNVVIR